VFHISPPPPDRDRRGWGSIYRRFYVKMSVRR
jgi:hypothetical protein